MDRREWLGDSQETFRASFRGEQAKLWTAIPATVLDVNLDRQTITAQGVINGVITNKDGSKTPLDPPVFINVPICFPRGVVMRSHFRCAQEMKFYWFSHPAA